MENWEQKYKEAIEKAKAKLEEAKVFDYDDEQTAHVIRLTTFDIFPELAESADARIKDWLIRYLENRVLNTGIMQEKENCEKAIAWLKKQGEQKPVDWLAELELILNNASSAQLHDIKERYFRDEPVEWSEDGEQKSVINDLENADREFNNILKYKVSFETLKMLLETWWKNTRTIIKEQKPEWSEEDENLLGFTLSNLAELKDRYGEEYGKVGKCMDWLKSLRPQKQWKPSEEQMGAIEGAVRRMKESPCYNSALVSLYKDLKEL